MTTTETATVPNAGAIRMDWRSLETWSADASCMDDIARKLLREYSKIPDEEMEAHVDDIRQKAFKVWPYPCIAIFRFLNLSIRTTPQYSEILERLKSGQKMLDLGCCFGQELRQLVFDGVPSENLYGSDLRPEFISLGYSLFRDESTLKATFIPSDVFDDSSQLVKQLSAKMDIIYTGSFFHLFGYDDQLAIAKRVVQLLRPVPGSLIVGRQIGNEKAGESMRPATKDEKERRMFRHNAESWREMWERVGSETGSRWEIVVGLDGEGWMSGPGMEAWAARRRAMWEARRKEMGEAAEGQRQERGASRRLSFAVRRL